MIMELKLVLESLLFSSQKPLSPRELRDLLSATAQGEDVDETSRAFKKTKEPEVVAALEQLAAEHQQAARSYRLVCVAGSWQFVCEPEYAPWLRTMFGVKARPPRLSQSALETLAIISYRQPVTRSEIEQIRGVSVDGVMQTLLERSLIESVGRAEVVGRPVLYGTTSGFLEYFGLAALADLPDADELRRIPVQKPESLATVDGLATPPPEQLTLAGGQKPDAASAPESANEPDASKSGAAEPADSGDGIPKEESPVASAPGAVEPQPEPASVAPQESTAPPAESAATETPAPRPRGRRKRKTESEAPVPVSEENPVGDGSPVPASEPTPPQEAS
jgi:segregation and condensation protein B